MQWKGFLASWLKDEQGGMTLSIPGLEFCAVSSPTAQQWHHDKVGNGVSTQLGEATHQMWDTRFPESSKFPGGGVDCGCPENHP